MEADVASSSTEQLIARPYQAELEEIAINSNTIIYLPTGSGKTFIAICLIKRFRQALQKPWGEGGKRTFFLVNNIPLVNQQKISIESLCAVSGVGGYSGEDGVDYWDKEKWDTELKKNQIIVMTSQILCDMLTHQYIRIEDINLLIFDECHHAVEDHPMRIIMKHFEDCPKSKQPRVLGLTATLLNANVKLGRVAEALRELEITFHATIATVDELGKVLNYSTNPNEMIQLYRSNTPTTHSQIAIKKLEDLKILIMSINLPQTQKRHTVKLKFGQHDISSDPMKLLKAVKNMVSSMIMFIEDLGTFGGNLGILSYIILLERLKKKATNKQEEYMFRSVITYCNEARLVLLKAMENETGYERIVKHSSERVLLLLNILKEYSPKVMHTPGVILKVNKNRQQLSAIIFTKQRFTAKVLYNLLKEVKETNPQDFDFLKHDFVVGFNVNPTSNTREDHFIKKASQQALLKFKNSNLNCLISTSVIEEGIDVPQCLLVLRYDPPLEYRSYIQSKGRARSAESCYVILVDKENEKKFMNSYREFQHTEQLIQRILVGNSDDRDEPGNDELQSKLYGEGDIPPYVAPSGARLTCVSSISLLNRYCSVLPTDQFTVITPMWIHEKVEKDGVILHQVSILMPIASHIKEEIKGMCLPNIKSAKRSAALNACIKLHEAGELDSGLLPVRYTSVDFDETDVKDIFTNWREEDVEADTNTDPLAELLQIAPTKPGTKKKIRKHQIQFPVYLNSDPNEDNYYLHIIKTKANFEEPEDSRERILYHLIGRKEGYGFLTQKPLPKLCDFPMFMTVGEVATSIEVNYAVIKLNTRLFDLVKQFHFFLFDQVLNVAKKFVVFEGKVNCMYFVAVKEDNGYDIDWNTMAMHDSIAPVQPTSDEERHTLDISPESYKECIVTPWYRVLPDRYIVSKVLEHMTPDSKFDCDSTITFKDYYADKYKLEIIGPKDQPLLEVRNISSRMNCLLPRAATIMAFSDKQRKLISASQGDDKNRGFTETFVPEFCVKYDFPGILWYKAVMLPSICHRVFMLLTAHELLTEIANHIKYGSPVRSISKLSQLTEEEYSRVAVKRTIVSEENDFYGWSKMKRSNCGEGIRIRNKDDDWHPVQSNLQVAINSLLSQVEEPTQINSVDRINNGDEEKRPNILSMKESLYQLQQKKLNKEFPWDVKSEPIDIDRNISTVTVLDIDCYDDFVTTPIMTSPTREVRSPPRIVTSAAISAAPAKYNDKIELLSRTLNNKGPELKDMLAALTVIKAHDAFDLERVETLGDSFLKFAASLYLYHKFPTKNEGQLTNIKCRLISNRNLYYAGEKFNLAGRMKVEQFSPRKDFLVPGFFAAKEIKEFVKEKSMRPTSMITLQFPLFEALSGELSPESLSAVREHYTNGGPVDIETKDNAQNAMQCYIHAQAVSDKTVADCVEAIIGTYFLSGGVLGAIKVIEWMEIIPAKDKFAEYLHKSVPTVITEKKATPAEIDFLLTYSTTDVEAILNYKFNDPSFLLEALSHSSYIRNRLTHSYERLEFLGDAILDFLITSHMFENCPDLKPGEMTDLRSALVNNVTFASYVVKLGLHKFLCSELNPTLSKAIIMFVDHQVQRNHEIVEDVLYLIDEEECQVAEYVEVPKVLSDVFEALVGAIFLDCGGNLEVVWSVIYRIMWKEINTFSTRIPQQPVKVLYEKIHACPTFSKAIMVDPDIPKIKVSVTITKNGRQHTVYGIGRNKSQAKRAAAKVALKVLSL